DFHVTGVQTCALPILSRTEFERQFPELAFFANMKAREVQRVQAEGSTPGGMLQRNLRVALTVFTAPKRVCKQFPERQVCYTDTRSEERRVGKGDRRRW